ncbi:hypothetical protein, variant [Puccinia triticina 1-1 BBBD Race 1]|uniref:Uncharacterized protein n=1 Tax=Puccinia triticina (isolate 1-1 / race 1 (BBBD)) TaxID=630390 RepID=A0A180GHP0_PUCT1|nr:hypothetical protein, variant [Puccinia triticina 1-1 BBBD Race 1]
MRFATPPPPPMWCRSSFPISPHQSRRPPKPGWPHWRVSIPAGPNRVQPDHQGPALDDRSTRYRRTAAPSACAVRTLLLNLYPNVDRSKSDAMSQTAYQETLTRQLQLSKELYLDPGFFSSLSNLRSIHLAMIKLSISSFTFLLSSLAPSLSELGLHDVYFIGAEDTVPIFRAIFKLPHLHSLSLTGRLVSGRCIIPMLLYPSNYFDSGKSLETLSLCDEGLTSAGELMLTPWDLVQCLENLLPDGRSHTDDHHDSSQAKYPSPLKIANYRFCMSDPEWHQPFRALYVSARAELLGIRVEVAHHTDPLQRIKWMSSTS